MRRKSKRIAAIVSTIVAGILAPATANASKATWIVSSGDFTTGANWNGATGGNGIVPGTADTGDVDNGGLCTIVSGDIITVNSMYAGDNPGATGSGAMGGTINQSGGSASISVLLAVGHNASTGLYNFTGGTINETGTAGGDGIRILGMAGNTSSAVMNISDATGTNTGTIINDAGFTDVGGNGTTTGSGAGTLNFSGGTINSNGSSADPFTVGNANSSTGIVNMTGGILNVNNSLVIGAGLAANKSGGTGTFNLSAGTVNSANLVEIGAGGTATQGLATGTLNISGTGTFIHSSTSAGDFQVGGMGVTINATLNLNGGSLIVDHISDQSTSGTQSINFNGGVLQANTSDANFIRKFNSSSQAPTLNVGNGGLTFNTSSYLVGVQLPLLHSTAASSIDGGLTKLGGGTLTLSGSDTYTGQTNVNAGALDILGSLNSNIVVASGASVGSYNTSGTTTGNTSGTLQFNGSSTLLVNPTGSQFLTVAGAANASGATVLVSPTISTAPASAVEVLYAKGGIVGTVGAAGSGANYVPGVRGSLSIVADPSGVGQDLVLNAASAGAANLVWTGSASNSTYWDIQGTANWYNTGTAGADLYNQGDNVTFDDSASSYAVAIQANVSPGSVTFNNSAHAYTVTGPGAIMGSTGLTKLGSSSVAITSPTTYTGSTLIQNGTVQVGFGGAIGSGGPLVLGSNANSGALILGDGNGAVSQTVSSLTTSGTGTANSITGGSSSVSTLTVNLASGTNTFGGTIGSGTAGVSTANSLAIVKNGGGTLILTGSNTYTGGNTIGGGGTLNVSSASLGTGPLAFLGNGVGTTVGTGNGILQAASNLTIASAVSLGTASAVFDTQGHTITLSGAVTNIPTATAIIQPIGNGSLILSGTFSVVGSNTGNGTTDSGIPSLLMASQGTTVTLSGTGNMNSNDVGWNGTSNTLYLSSAGTINMSDPGPAMDAGQQGGNGVIIQTSGTVTSAGNLNLGKWDTSYGSYTLMAGTLNLANVYSAGKGNGSSSTLITQVAGTANITGQTCIGYEGNGTSVINVTGGTYNSNGSNFLVGQGLGGTGILTIGGGTVNATAVTIANATNNASSFGIINTNNGNFVVNNIKSTSGLADSILNLTGGKIGAGASSGMFINFLTAANVYAPATAQTFNTGSQSITISQNLTGTGGTGGLSTATVGSGGTGYIGAPVVSISGGGGTGATAVATISAGSVIGITFTSAGTGYTSAPTINLIGGGGSGASVNATPVTNATDTGIIKAGAGTLTMNGISTYAGGTQIRAGTLVAGKSTAFGSGPIAMNTSSTLALAALPAMVSITPSTFSVNSNTNIATTPTGFSPIIGGNTNSILLTSAANSQATSVFSNTPVTFSDSTGFVASFIYNHATTGAMNAVANGITFALSENSSTALGAAGNAIGYAGTNTSSQGIANSIAAAVDEYDDQLQTGVNGYWVQSSNTGLATNTSSAPFISASPSSQVTISYAYNASAGTGALTETVTSLSNGSSYSMVTNNIDLAAALGGTAGGTASAYFGFTGGTGAVSDAQSISNFSLNTTSTNQTLSAVNIANAISVNASSTAILQLAPTAGNSYGSVGPITINTGSTLTVSIGSAPAAGVLRGVLATPSVTFANSSSGTLDIKNNALDITTASQASIVQAEIASAYAGGAWNGSGITSSVAATDTSHLTAVGMLINNDGHGNTIYGVPTGTGPNLGLFDGASPSLNDILVKYTYYGDANLDGAVDGSDYALIDAGFLSGGALIGWQNGDFNYDGVVDGSDYTLIDNAFNTQGATLGVNPNALAASSAAQFGGSSAVPEPASFGVLLMGSSLLVRRRYRQ